MGNTTALASASKQSRVRMASRCVPQTANGTISFKITSYRQQKHLVGIGECIKYPILKVGGYSWRLYCSPNGDHRKKTEGFIGVHLGLVSKNVIVRVLYHIRLIDQTTMSSSTVIICMETPIMLSNVDADSVCSYSGHGCCNSPILKRSDLEKSRYLLNDSLLFECDIAVIKEPRVVKTSVVVQFPRPLRNLTHDTAKLLETMDGADVMLDVQGQFFPAHTIMLAMRSPVFKKQFHDLSLKQRHEGQHLVTITIEDIRPEVFKAFLHFVYTDSMCGCLKGPMTRDEKTEFAKNLLVAADRYEVEKLKFKCETRLSKSLDTENAAAMLALADRHNCSMLKGACIDFITCPDNMASVVASEGYDHLKESCPGDLVNLFGLAERDM